MTACAAEPEPEPVKLTISSAAAAYLEAVCPVNEAWDDLDFAVDQLRLTLDAAGGSVVTDEVVDAVARYELALSLVGEESLAAADTLESPDQLWPQKTVRLVRQVAKSMQADGAEAVRLMKLEPGAAASAIWPDAVESAQTAAETREALALPADSAAACAGRPKPEPVEPREVPGSEKTTPEGTKP